MPKATLVEARELIHKYGPFDYWFSLAEGASHGGVTLVERTINQEYDSYGEAVWGGEATLVWQIGAQYFKAAAPVSSFGGAYFDEDELYGNLHYFKEVKPITKTFSIYE